MLREEVSAPFRSSGHLRGGRNVVRPRLGVNCFLLLKEAGGLRQYFCRLFRELLQLDSYAVTFYCGERNLSVLQEIGEPLNRATIRVLWDQSEIIGHWSDMDLFFCPFGPLYPRPVPVPAVIMLADIQEKYHPEFFTEDQLWERAFHFDHSLHVADRVITISEFSKESFVEKHGIDRGKITVAYLAPSEAFSQEGNVELPPSLPERFIVFPANRWKHKNHDLLFRALHEIRTSMGIDVPCVLTGYDVDGDQRGRDLCEHLGIADLIHIPGFIPEEQLVALYRHAEMLVFPSLFEGFGMPVVEAMACGCPIVAANATSLPEIGGDAAVCFDPESFTDFAEKIVSLWGSRKRQEELGRLGLSRASSFSFQETARIHRQVFDELLSSPPSRPNWWRSVLRERVHDLQILKRNPREILRLLLVLLSKCSRVPVRLFNKVLGREPRSGGSMFKTASEMFFALESRRTETVQEISRRWDVSPEYVDAYVDNLFSNHRDSPRAAAYLEAEMSLYHRTLGALQRLQRESGVKLQGRDVLDAGCGNGNSLRALDKLGVKRVVGLEYADYQIESCKKVCELYGLNAEVVQESILSPDLSERLGTFDVVLSFDVLEHVPDIPKAIQGMAQLLKPGGYAVITVGNRYWTGHMLQDPHYNLPGITLLPPREAKAYFDAAHGGQYDVVDWPTRQDVQDYLDAAKLHFRPELVPEYPNLRQQVKATLGQLRVAKYPSEEVREQVCQAVDELERAAEDRDDYSDFFGTPMFTFIARLGKMPPPPAAGVRLKQALRTVRNYIVQLFRAG